MTSVYVPFAVRRFLRSVLQAIPLIVCVLLLNFTLMQFLPGDAAEIFAAESGIATPESMEQLRAQFGVDLSLGEQLLQYTVHLAHGDLGYSVRYNAPVAELILSRLGMTLLLKVSALLLALLVGVAVGVIMARYQQRLVARLLSLVMLGLYSTPGFWIGLMLIVAFSINMNWLPADGYQTLGADLQGWPKVRDTLAHMVLPVCTAAAFFVAMFARLTCTAMCEIRELDHVRTARAKGLGEWPVLLRHVLRNALIPLTTVTGMHVGTLLSGAVVIETIFSWPGLGRLAYDAVLGREPVLLLGILLMSSLLVIIANVLTDTLQAWLDPRTTQ